ncbi:MULTISPECIES: magnesium-translocating P-type ATPase [Methylosinus]|uniref:Magnesium-transporting ATPase, P-type 1 n=1 Tax=Methylosinus trichosporium (strain ATCC 35070 / NCIMB 11131 / UNIQEM 75 / OB3b) TaxID=595536 RepID=A0A2D2D379_METT3|nr:MULTISPECIES: magnesium-translocating P-type ATPase [Methylosinus]ATQ69460.1 magnesium-translocating P-type ATPase [Methylosinus trichosporium OB3b]
MHRPSSPKHPPHDALLRAAQASSEELLARLGTTRDGLSAREAARRLRQIGLNRIARERRPSMLRELAGRARNPLNALLLSLALASYALGELRAAIVIAAMVVLSVGLAFVQEHRSNEAAARLQAMVRTHASVRRPGAHTADRYVEEPVERLAPGDILRLSAGDMIPADLRLIEARDLFVNQSTLTGESMPVEKIAQSSSASDPFEAQSLALMGANVVSGYATAVVVETGRRTVLGAMADEIAGPREETSFDKGVTRFTLLMMVFMSVMAPAVFVINGVTKGDWLQAMLFAVSVAVGLTPEMLPMIVTVNLAKGAIAMARKKAIVKRLNSIQNFGAMDVLCTDKTGTLTQDRIILKRCLDIFGEESARVLELAYLNSHFQSGLKNLLDRAVLEHHELAHALRPDHAYEKIDEIPFDFERRRLSVVVRRDDGPHLLICKGAVEELFAASSRYETESGCGVLDPSHLDAARREMEELNGDGFRVVAVAYRELPQQQTIFAPTDECDLILVGYIAFLDPPKDSAAGALAALAKAGVAVKILTGDNDVVTRKVCKDVGLAVERVALGADVERASDDELTALAERTAVFAKLSPPQKARVIDALHRGGHVVGYLGDGINDGPALKAADVGVSVDTAVDIAKELADIILLEKSLAVLGDGVLEGRRVFANIVKYIKMGASSNFGNMFSVLGASAFLPFLPMTPLQVITNNMLYDISQSAIPTDTVDEEYLAAPRRWDIDNIAKFVLCIGPISSIFDYATFVLMIFVFGALADPTLFQTGWFVESLLTQTLVIHVIRTARIPFLQSRASDALMLTTIAVCLVGAALPFSPLADVFGLTPLPLLYWPALLGFLLCYAALAQIAKSWFARRWGM